MVKNQQKITGKQPDLFQCLSEPTIDPENAQDLDIQNEMIGALTKAIRDAKHYGMSRERIVERMNLCLPELHKPLTLRQLNGWTARSQESRDFPARYLPAFCWATNSILPLLVLAQSIDHDLVDRRDQLALEFGQKMVERARLNRDVNELKKYLER